MRYTNQQNIQKVAPLAGVWIEIDGKEYGSQSFVVAPLAGVWIEIDRIRAGEYPRRYVALLAGVWIEIKNGSPVHSAVNGRSPRGSVD